MLISGGAKAIGRKMKSTYSITVTLTYTTYTNVFCILHLTMVSSASLGVTIVSIPFSLILRNSNQ